MGVHRLRGALLFLPSDLQNWGIHVEMGGQCHTLDMHVLCGLRFKSPIPEETWCIIAFSFSSVRWPGRDELMPEEAIALMRRKILQRDVKVVVHEVLGCGKFYFHTVDLNQRVALIQWQLASNLQGTLVVSALIPAKLVTIHGHFIPDDSRNRALVRL
ncbi:unnamed protein product [Spirodela intermedia]|uniref:Uncharacterized protein n=2 Tax=Spirodela intermedia TaxID=51605 RepID=A0A7I8L4N3_SPIIN|nr:unnamed protein product [Spirodela intermedia]CAA6668059.1 unnamed protein product [Spirodela intermedia]CAA7404890.1 unnamed protein product [Spirodela intermedia]